MSFLKKISNNLKKDIGVIFVIGIAFLSVLSLFHTGLPPTHDGEYHVIRFFEFDKTLRDGNWYPVWAPDLNYTYGSPLFNYVYPLPNYFSSIMHLLGFSFIDAFKGNLVLASFIGSIGAFLYGRQRFSSWGGILTSTFYTFAPYHFLDIYIRGSVGEVWALALFPFCLWMFDKLSKNATLPRIAYAAIFYSLIIFSHNILAVMFSGFLATYIIFLAHESKDKKKTVIALCISILLGLLMSSIFFLPALLEQKYVVGLKVFDVEKNFPELFQLLVPSWGSGFSGGTLSDQMSFQVGMANLVVVVIACVGLVWKKKKNVFHFFLLAWFTGLFFLITPYSSNVWRIIPLLSYFQFPWRLLSLLILVNSILAGSLISIYKSRVLYITVMVVLLLTTFSYAHPPYFFNRGDDFYTKNPNFIYGTNSIGNVFQTTWFPQQKKLPSAYDEKKILVVKKTSNMQTYRVHLLNAESVKFNTAYFPGWTGYINNNKKEIYEVNGLISVNLPKGDYLFSLRFENTLIRVISAGISGIAIIFVLLLIFKGTMLQYFYAHRN